MSPLEAILWVLAFAVATAVIYGWGLAKSRNQKHDLLMILYAKGESKVKKLLKKSGTMSRSELEKALSGMRVSLFYSRSRQAIVENPKVFTAELLRMMSEQSAIIRVGRFYKLKS